MNDDWRLRVTLRSSAAAAELGEALRRGRLEHELAASAAERVIVSVDGRELFVYGGTREQLERARQAIAALAGTRGWEADAELRHWHPTAEQWEDPDVPLPQSDSELAAERLERVAREREESRELGFSEYEVRVQCESHHDAAALAERLRREGLRPLRRWRYLVVGAGDEDVAQALAERLTGELPPGSTVTVEGSLAAVAAETPPNPFAVFGGLGM
jgi:hypothetical protein